MKALSLWQPWATLIALGEKRFETRDWATSYRGPLAIHAAKTWNRETRWACADAPIAAALTFHDQPCGDGLPLGCIVATCRLVACIHMPEDPRDLARCPDWPASGIGERELAFGDFSPGRYAWKFVDVLRLPKPISAKGARGLWDWEPRR